MAAAGTKLVEPKLESTFTRVVVVDNIPVVTKEKYEKLLSYLQRVMVTMGPLREDGVFVPTDDTGASKGYGFFEYQSEKSAQEALEKLQGYKMDKTHMFRISPFDDVERYAALEEKFVPPEVKPYQEKQYLGSWLEDNRYVRGAEMYLTQCANNIDVWWHLAKQPKPELGCPHMTVQADTIANWSPRGSYIVSFHVQGIMLWGGKTFMKLYRYPHPDVRYAEFSPCENYLVTARDHGVADTQPVLVWDVKAQKCLKTFLPVVLPERKEAEPEVPKNRRTAEAAAVGPVVPLFWSADDKYLARMVPDAIEIYEMPSFSLVGGAPLRVPGVQDVQWSPKDNVLAYFVPERANQPARVVIYDVRRRVELRQSNVFNVADCRMAWHSDGDYLCIRVATVVKANKPPLTNFIIVNLRDKNISTEMFELPERVVAFAWEPCGNRFAVATNDGTKTSMSFYDMSTKRPVLAHRAEKKQVTDIFWSPRGGVVVLADLVSSNGAMEFFNAIDMEVMAIAEHFSTSSIEWDPSGRYVTIVTSAWKHPGAESGFTTYHFTGEQMQKTLRPKFYQFKWRPRPKAMLSKEALEALKKKMPSYVQQFALEADEEKNKLSEEERSRRSRIVAEFNEIMVKRLEDYRREASDRVLLRDGEASDTEDDFVEVSTIVSQEVLEEKVVAL